MAALTFDDLIPEGGAQPQASGRPRVQALTFDDLIPGNTAKPQTVVPGASRALTEDFDRLTADASMTTGAPAPPRSRTLTFEDFDALTAEPQSTASPGSYTSRAVDLGRSILSGLDSGVAGVAGLPADIARGAIALSDYERAWRSGEPYERVRDQRDATAPMSSTALDAYGSAAAHANSPARYDPQTAVGRGALNRTIEGMPADSVGVIDLVQRRMREGADAARAPGQGTTSNLIASNFDDARAAPIAAAETVTGGPTGSYAAAREAQARLRQTELEPLTAGPVGALSRTEDAAQQAGGLLPSAPKVAGAEAGVGDAVRRVATRDPEAAQGLIRGHVRAAFDEATQRLPSGPNELGGAKFASAISGNTQQAANLEAAVRALPGGDQRWEGFRRMLDVMEATGQRPPPGSSTAFIQEGQREMRQGSRLGDVVQAGKTGGTSLLKRFNEWKEQADLGRNTTQIAALLTRPDAARVLGQLANTPPNAARAQVLALRLTYMGRSGSQASGTDE